MAKVKMNSMKKIKKQLKKSIYEKASREYDCPKCGLYIGTYTPKELNESGVIHCDNCLYEFSPEVKISFKD